MYDQKKRNKFQAPKESPRLQKRERATRNQDPKQTYLLCRIELRKILKYVTRCAPLYLRGKVLCPDVSNFSGCFVLEQLQPQYRGQALLGLSSTILGMRRPSPTSNERDSVILLYSSSSSLNIEARLFLASPPPSLV